MGRRLYALIIVIIRGRRRFERMDVRAPRSPGARKKPAGRPRLAKKPREQQASDEPTNDTAKAPKDNSFLSFHGSSSVL